METPLYSQVWIFPSYSHTNRSDQVLPTLTQYCAFDVAFPTMLGVLAIDASCLGHLGLSAKRGLFQSRASITSTALKSPGLALLIALMLTTFA
jgi:hypothetical protein